MRPPRQNRHHHNHHRHRDVEMPMHRSREHHHDNYHKTPKSVRDPIFEEDIEDFQRNRCPVYSRLISCILGALALFSAALGAYYFLQKDEIDLQKGAKQHENFQGTVTFETIQQHAAPEDCWMAIHGNVYDFTEYAPIHPGPPSLITRLCGKEATKDYDFEHSVALLPIVDEYLLGTFAAAAEGEGTPAPSLSPSSVPTMFPTTSSPSRTPTFSPTTSHPTTSPSISPSLAPSMRPTTPRPTEPEATPFPTSRPTTAPPTKRPTPPPTPAPTPQPTTPAPTPPPTPPPTEAPQGCTMEFYTLADVAQHPDASSCWYVLYGVVYDFTSYINQHEGGRGTVLAGCGTDASELYQSENGHTRNLLQRGGHASRIIGRYGTTRQAGTVPCDEVNLVAVT